MPTFKTMFDIGTFVKIDEDDSIKARILAVTIREATVGTCLSYEVSWFHNGNPVKDWVEEWRLTSWEE